MYHIQIVGAGYTGSRIAAYFRTKKQKVWGLVRSGQSRAVLEKAGIVPVIADLARPESLKTIPPAHFIVISPAPSEGERGEAGYRRLYLEGIGNYLEAVRAHPRPNLLVYLSSTSVYGERGGEWVDEDTPPAPDTEKGKILLAAEEQVLSSGFPAIVFRLGGIYGPGRNGIERLRRGEINSDGADKYLNHIHVEDIAGAMPVLFNRGEAGKIYLGVDDEPVKRSEMIRWLCGKLGIPEPAAVFSSKEIKGRRLSNKRLKSLGYAFKFPSYREGYEDILCAATF